MGKEELEMNNYKLQETTGEISLSFGFGYHFFLIKVADILIKNNVFLFGIFAFTIKRRYLKNKK